MVKEIWKDIEGYENLYQVSNMGRVKSLKRCVVCENGSIRHFNERILKSSKNSRGYLTVELCKENKKKTYIVHRLVAEAFIPNPDNKSTVDHINTIKTDNSVENLRWFTQKEQINDNKITKEKHKENIKKAHKKLSKKVINLDNGEVFDSIAEAARKYNLSSNSHIIRCCKDEQKTAAGYHWAYYNNEDKEER